MSAYDLNAITPSVMADNDAILVRRNNAPALVDVGVLVAKNATRADFVALLAGGFVPPEGEIFHLDGISYSGRIGATAIPDMPGLVPNGDVDLAHFGVKPTNLAIDATDNVVAIQAAIDFVASKTNGGTVHARGFGSIVNPIITINAPIVLKRKVSLDFGKVRFRAAVNMSAMIDSVAGSSGRLEQQFIKGGFWDCDQKASSCFRLREFQQIEISDLEIVECDGNAIHLNDAAQSSSNFEVKIKNVLIERSNTISPSNSRGIYADPAGGQFTSDSIVVDVVPIGYQYGIDGTWFASDFTRVHPWSYPPTQGEMIDAFRISGGTCRFSQCYADNASRYGYNLDGPRFIINNCTTLRNDTVADNAGACVYLASGSEAIVTSCTFNGASALARWAKDFDGDLSKLIAQNNRCTNVVTQVGNYDLSYAGPYTPTITAGTNVTSASSAECRFTRVNKVVTVSGMLVIQVAALGAFDLTISLPPLATMDITESRQLTGSAITALGSVMSAGGILGDTATDTAKLSGEAKGGAGVNTFYAFSFSYRMP